MVKNIKKQKVEKLAVVIKCSDGSVRQVVLTDDETANVEGFIQSLHNGKIKVFPKVIETIDL